MTIETNPDRPNVFYASHARPDRGEDKLEPILKPIVHELKLKKTEMPVTLIYGSLETIADSFLYFTSHMGKDQYYPSAAEPCAKNRLFTQYHAQYPEYERNRIIEELVKGTSTHRVLFVTVAFGLGIDCNNIGRVVHIGVPYSMEEYCQEVGTAGRDGLPARADIYYNSYDISLSRKNMTEVMRNFVKSKDCKRQIILNYFDHKVPDIQPQHMCCDFHLQQCHDCRLARAVDNIEISSDQQETMGAKETEVKQHVTIISEAKANIRKDLIAFRLQLQKDIGRSTVGSVPLSNRFPIKLIDLTMEHLPELHSVEKVKTILPLYSDDIASALFSIIKKHTSL